jgi:hypothetical protein
VNATLVDPVVSARKFQTELDRWMADARRRERGWLLLDQNHAAQTVEIGFLTRVSITAAGPLPIMPCAVRIAYDNYDLWAPSVLFIDPLTRQPAKPAVSAFHASPEGPRNVLIDAHPLSGHPFLCVPGIREYHNHPQHTGDDWLLHRETGAGSLGVICDRIWRFMIRNIFGIQVQLQTLPDWPLKAQIRIQLAQGEVIDGSSGVQ